METKMMTTDALVALIAEKNEISKVSAKNTLSMVVDALTDAITSQDYDSIKVGKLGTVKVDAVAERMGRNPQTGDAVVIPAHNKVSFKFSKGIKDAVR